MRTAVHRQLVPLKAEPGRTVGVDEVGEGRGVKGVGVKGAALGDYTSLPMLRMAFLLLPASDSIALISFHTRTWTRTGKKEQRELK